jgi:hypothetical protein
MARSELQQVCAAIAASAASAICSVASAGAEKCASSRHSRTQLAMLWMLATSLSQAEISLLSTEKSPSLSGARRWPFLSKTASRRARAAARSSALRAWNSSSERIWFWKNLLPWG